MIEFLIVSVALLVGAYFCTSIILRNIVLSFAILFLLIGFFMKSQIEHYDCDNVDCSSKDSSTGDAIVNIPVDESGNAAVFSGKFPYTKYGRFCDSDTDYSKPLGSLLDNLKDPLVSLLQTCITSVSFNPLEGDTFSNVTLVFNKNVNLVVTCQNLQLDNTYNCESGVYESEDGTVCIDLCLTFAITAKDLTLDLFVDNLGTNVFNVNVQGSTKCRVGIEVDSTNNSVVVSYLELNDQNYNDINVFSSMNGNITLIKGLFQYLNGFVPFFNKTIIDVLYDQKILPYTIPGGIPTAIINDILSINLVDVPTTFQGLQIPNIPVDVTVGYIEFQSIFTTDVFYYLQFIIKNSNKITFFPNICSNSPTSCDGCDSLTYKNYNFSECCQGSSLYNIDFSCQTGNNALNFKMMDIDFSATIDHLCSINLFKLIPALFNQCKLEQVALKPCTTESSLCDYPGDHECGDLKTYPWGCLFCPFKDSSEFEVSICDIDLSSFIDDAKFELLSVLPAFKSKDSLDVDQNKLNYVFSIVSGEGIINTNISMKGKTIVELLKYVSPETPDDPDTWYNDVLQIQFENLRLIVNGVHFDKSGDKYVLQTDSFDLTFDNFTIVNIANLDYQKGFCDDLSEYAVITKLYCGFFALVGDLLTNMLVDYAPQIYAILLLLMILIPIIALFLPFYLPAVIVLESALITLLFVYWITAFVAVIVNGTPLKNDSFYKMGTLLIGTIFPWGKISTTIFSILNNKLKDNANTILKSLLLPIIPKDTFLTLFETGKDYNCSCKNICARNWDNLLTKNNATNWKNASCGQTVQLDVSGSSVVQANYYNCEVYPPPKYRHAKKWLLVCRRCVCRSQRYFVLSTK